MSTSTKQIILLAFYILAYWKADFRKNDQAYQRLELNQTKLKISLTEQINLRWFRYLSDRLLEKNHRKLITGIDN